MVEPAVELTAEQRIEVADWFQVHGPTLPEAVRIFMTIHMVYLLAGSGSLRKALETAVKELRRALRITPSSEKRRPSGSPLADLPKLDRVSAKSAQEALEAEVAQAQKLAHWHRDLRRRHGARAKRLREKLAKMIRRDTKPEPHETIPLEDIELSPEDLADSEAAAARFVEDLRCAGSA